MKETTSAITYAKRWNELNWDALIRYHSIIKTTDNSQQTTEEAASLMERMQEFEVVSGLEVMGMGVDIEGANEAKGTGDKLRWLEKEIGNGGTCVWLRRRDGVNGKNGQEVGDDANRVVMKREEFVQLIHEKTEWMQKKEGLLKLPEKWVVIDGETFALPALVGDGENVVRYGQYGDMQMYMMGIMTVMGKIDEELTTNDEQQKEMLEQLRMYRNSFLATLLLPTVMEEIKVDDVNEKCGYKWVTQRKVKRYDGAVRERIAEKMDKAPSWLFSLLWHLVQSCLAYYHGRFPDLVSKDSGKNKKNTDMYVAKLGTDNAVMKYAGYPNVKTVNDEPVGVILERLDAMAKESKEWEKARRKK